MSSLGNQTGEKFLNLVKIMRQLRLHCPWDKEQTVHSLRQYILEETYEVIETIDQELYNQLAEELGDLLLQIIFQSAIAEEKGIFNIDMVLDTLNTKLINRHPHVFDKTKVYSSEKVKYNWEKIKRHEKKRDSLLDGVPKTAPALLRAQRIQEKASMIDFDWNRVSDVLDKLQEELVELHDAVERGQQEEIMEEIGDLLFSLVNVSRFFKIVAEDALRVSTDKFIQRFEFIENHYKKNYDKMKKASLKELDAIWDQAKEKNVDPGK
jgi:tetrapyrrole methylase family protein/MazG family protein